ncbi:MAG: phosphatase PAP2 family protein [Candidatus Eremiobacteraeota bacterium]|nr:phosphatase PAP2 family protein [Candidatus Eremiobacteraeota bacterium]
MHTALFVHSLWQHAWLSKAMVALAQYGLLVSAAAMLLGLVRSRRYNVLLWLLPAAAVAVALTIVAGHTLFDARPFVALHTAPLVPHSSDNGFPSDHSSVAGFIAVAACFLDPLAGAVAIGAALGIGIARIYCLLHWPGDVIAGWCIGALPAIVACVVWRKYGSFARHRRV